MLDLAQTKIGQKQIKDKVDIFNQNSCVDQINMNELDSSYENKTMTQLKNLECHHPQKDQMCKPFDTVGDFLGMDRSCYPQPPIKRSWYDSRRGKCVEYENGVINCCIGYCR